MRCHCCDGEAVVTIQISGRYMLYTCYMHEDTVYHDIEHGLYESMLRLLKIDGEPTDDQFRAIHNEIQRHVNYIPYVDMAGAEEHRKHVGPVMTGTEDESSDAS